jgi:mycofactocin system glycosyltransferase
MKGSLGEPPAGDLPVGLRVALAQGVTFWAHGAMAMGGVPWRVVRLSDAARPFVGRLRAAGPQGCPLEHPTDRLLARLLLDRGLVHPVIETRPPQAEVPIVIPAYGRAEQLNECLRSLAGLAADAVVVDDASLDLASIRHAADAHGARLIRHDVNKGPAAARNTGLRATASPFVAFVDMDCIVDGRWLNRLLPHFDDPLVAVVAPRVRPAVEGRSLLGRHEDARSALDMGDRPELVRPGGRLGFVPSAVLVVRRVALGDSGFDEGMRLGEDVDLVWRLVDAGWLVRYDPAATVRHEARLEPVAWVSRRFDYGTSAADLHKRHPGRLAPARPSAWNLVSLGLLVSGRPRSAALVSVAAAAVLGRRLGRAGGGTVMAGVIVGKGLVADAAALGHALRREWWPVGILSLATVRRVQLSRAAACCMLGPIAYEWLRHLPDVDPASYAWLRLVEDAAYGSGVLVSAWRARSVAPLCPLVRLPWTFAKDGLQQPDEAPMPRFRRLPSWRGRAGRSAAT